MKYKQPHSAAILFMTIFYRPHGGGGGGGQAPGGGGAGPLAHRPSPGSATDLGYLIKIILIDMCRMP